MIDIRNVDKIYDNGFQAVFDFTARIEDNEFVVMVGPSGCGKSTMIRTIAGLEQASAGQIRFDDKVINNVPANKRGIAMVFQSYALYPHLSVAENMGFGLELAGYDEDFVEKRVKDVATLLGIDTLLERKPRQLSGGQRQRVAVGRAIIRHPKVFLMDEPLSNLDTKQRVLMRSEIVEIHRRTGAITIYVTHDQTEAMTMADKIICMKDGRIQQMGTPHELYFTPKNKFVAGFLGEPPMNFLAAEIRGGKLSLTHSNYLVPFNKTCFDKVQLEEGRKVILGFRPEAASDKSVGVVFDEKEGFVFGAVTKLKELLGDVSNLYAGLGEDNIIIKIPQTSDYAIGNKFDFFVRFKDMYLFDAETEEGIYNTNASG